MPDVPAHQAAVQARPEQFPRRGVKPRHVQAQAARRAVPHLHSGEVAVVYDRRIRELVSSRRPAVDLNARNVHERRLYRGSDST